MSSILATLICTDAWSLAPMMVLEAELFGVEEGGGRGERKGEGYFPVRREACSQRGRLPCMFVLGYTGTSFGKRCEDERVGKSETVISSSFFFSPLFLSSLCATPQHSAAYPPGTQLTVVCEFAKKTIGSTFVRGVQGRLDYSCVALEEIHRQQHVITTSHLYTDTSKVNHEAGKPNSVHNERIVVLLRRFNPPTSVSVGAPSSVFYVPALSSSTPHPNPAGPGVTF